MISKSVHDMIAERKAQAEAARLGIDIRPPSEFIEVEIDARGEIAECGKVIPFGVSRQLVHASDFDHLLKLSCASSPKHYDAVMSRLETMRQRDAKGERGARPSFEAAYYDVCGESVPPLKSVRLASEVDAERAERAKAIAEAEAKAEAEATKARVKADAKIKAEIEAEAKTEAKASKA